MQIEWAVGGTVGGWVEGDKVGRMDSQWWDRLMKICRLHSEYFMVRERNGAAAEAEE